jgi:hypothetical protein
VFVCSYFHWLRHGWLARRLEDPLSGRSIGYGAVGAATHPPSVPVPVFVDDAAIIGADPQQVDAEAASLAAFLLLLGVVMKDIKTRYAAILQLYIGLWWNSVTRTLELEQSKLDAYLAVFQGCGFVARHYTS